LVRTVRGSIGTPPTPGSIITFYSYKGGTGRSMALANVGCLLALRQAQAGGRGVLLVDWDLEAPGLHRFFRDRFRRALGSQNDYAGALERFPGLIDLFWKLAEISPAGLGELTPAAEAELRQQLDVREFVLETDIESLHVLKAGRFGEDYPRRVGTFRWEELYQKAPWLIPWFGSWLAERYQYVLIDSRTGVTDTSGICTMLLPEKLVVVFTPNLQSTEGAVAQIEAATAYRRRSDDLRPLIVYLLPSRIESTLPTLRERWRLDPAYGYQPRFEALFKRVYGLSACDLTDYFNDNQVPQVPDYAYGEEIAVLEERGADKFSLTRSYQSFTDRLLSAAEPWEKPGEVESRAALEDLLRRAYSVVARLSPEQSEQAYRALTRLVQVSPGLEVGPDGHKRARLSDFAVTASRALEPFVEAGVLRRLEFSGGQEPLLELADPALIEAWTPLKEWIEKDREFLLWRQRLDDAIAQWRGAGRGNDLLLRGTVLARAQQELAKERSADLNYAEQAFIEESSLAEIDRAEEEAKRRAREQAALTAAAGAARSSKLVYGSLGALGFLIALVALIVYLSISGSNASPGPLGLRAIQFVDPDHGWMAGDVGAEGLAYRTDDGGRHWTSHPVPILPQSLSFVSSKQGWAAGYPGIAATSDGGVTWKKQPLPGGPFHLTAIQMQRAGPLGWAVGWQGAVLQTTDAGLSWSRRSFPQAEDFTAVSFLDADVAWTVSEEGSVWSTTNGGATWLKLAFGAKTLSFGPPLRAVVFLDRQHGWIAGADGIFATQDGGGSWKQQAAASVLSIGFRDSNTGWAVGIGTILLTRNGGASWAGAEYKGPIPFLRSLSFGDPLTGWACSNEGDLLRTVDGGNTWAKARF
jgi:photosystem II stability/assembly factor-like uncharacterized protein/cellulose biosynthesis protein BcsQ